MGGDEGYWDSNVNSVQITRFDVTYNLTNRANIGLCVVS